MLIFVQRLLQSTKLPASLKKWTFSETIQTIQKAKQALTALDEIGKTN